ncbi:MAG: hypothetical protein WCR97_04665 [Bacilli bacterium]
MILSTIDIVAFFNDPTVAGIISSLIPILSGSAMLGVAAMNSKAKTIFKNSTNKNVKEFGNLLEKTGLLETKLKVTELQNEELIKKQSETTDNVNAMVSIFSMVFMDSKSIDSETKLKIGNALGKLQGTGVDFTPINKAVKVATEKLEEVKEIKEQTETLIKTSTAEATDIVNKSAAILKDVMENGE